MWRWSRTWPVLALLLLTIGVLGALLLVFRSGDRAEAVKLVQAIVAVLAIVGPLAVSLVRRRRKAAATEESVDQAADVLMDQVRWQWEKAAVERRLRNPVPIPVLWEWSKLAVSGPMSDAVGGDAGRRRFAVLPGMSPTTAVRLRAGSLDDLLALYGGLDSGRMIILGAPGAGKSAAAVRLLLEMVAHRAGLAEADRRMTPVPVLLTVSGWDPRRDPITTWLADRLAADYRILNAGEYGSDAAAQLLERNKVTVILDALDELPPSLQRTALTALDEQTTFRLVLLTRSQELVEAAADAHLPGAAAIELLPVSAGAAADYLTRCQVQPLPPDWQRLTNHLRSEPDSVIARALDNPLMLTLVRDVFRGEDAVDVLLDGRSFKTPTDIEDYLLTRLLPAAYASRPGKPGPSYSAGEARDWLGHIAYRLEKDNTTDLRWWRILHWRPAAPRVITTSIIVGLTAATFAGLAVRSTWMGLLLGFVAGVAAAADQELWSTTPRYFGRLQWSQFVHPRTLLSAIVVGLLGGIGGGPLVGAALGSMAWLAVALIFGLAHVSGNADSPLDPLTIWRRDRQHGLVTGAIAAPGTIVMLWLVGWHNPILLTAVAILVGTVLAATFSKAWPATLACLQLRIAGEGPIRLLRFLEDARRRQVIRGAGPSYQFRHRRLQDRLAAEYRQRKEPY